jgi:glycosyltransferase involved in cell wall biosynthesis
VDSLYLGDLVGPAEAGIFGSRLFLIAHWIPSLEPGLSPSEARERRRKEDVVFGRAAGFLATSDLTRDALRRRGGAGKPVIVVRPALAVVPRGRKPGSEGFRALMVSNLVRGKGVLEFLERFRKEAAGKETFLIRIAGRSDIDPAYARSCLGEIGRPWPGGRVAFLGPKTSAGLKALYETSAVFVTASGTETYGMAFHEAMAFGLPILALRAPYNAAVPKGRGAVRLFDSVAALADGCAALIGSAEELAGLREKAWAGRTRGAYSWRDAARLFIHSRRETPIFKSG